MVGANQKGVCAVARLTRFVKTVCAVTLFHCFVG
jgi:hypothetical protein